MQASALLILHGRPITKKNHSVVVTRGRPRVLPSPQYRAYEKKCLRALKAYTGPRFDVPIRLCARYYMPSRQSWPDLVGLLQGTCDILQAAGIVKDDRLVVSVDGSGIAGVDKLNPRTEILIEDVEGGCA